MYIHNIDPILLKLGFLEIRYYGLVYLLGFILSFIFLRKNKKELGLNDEDITNLILYLAAGIIIGARIFHFVFSEPYTLIKDPFEIFRIWNGGMSFFGSLTGVILIGYIFCRKKKINFFKLADILVFPATISLILGRIANFINGELVGIITNVSWCVIFRDYQGCRHPYPIYAAISHLVLLLVLFIIYRLKGIKKLREGILFLSFIIFYSLFRILTDFLREDFRFFGFTIWQYMGLLFLLLGLF